MVVAGGGSRADNGDISGAEVYDASLSQWFDAGTMSDTRRLSPMTALDNGQVLVSGGASESGGASFSLRTAELYSGDRDGDQCLDIQEGGPNPRRGGDRDPLSPHDFFDTPVPALTAANPGGARNLAVTLSDVSAVLYYTGTSDEGPPNARGVDYDTDLNTNGADDGAEYDRTPSADASKPWRSRAPDGAVSVQDVSVALLQVGHSCQAAP